MNTKNKSNNEAIKPDLVQPQPNKKIIENHKQAAAHLMEAAQHHLDAATHHEAGNREKAAYSKLLALGHHTIAGEFLSDDAKHHAQELKQTGQHY